MNYAIPGQRMETGNYNARLARLDPYSQIMMDEEDNRAPAYDWFMRMLQPSTAGQGALRQLYHQFLPSYNSSVLSGEIPASTRWLDYLRSLDINREMQRLSREDRGEMQPIASFGRPGRYIPF